MAAWYGYILMMLMSSSIDNAHASDQVPDNRVWTPPTATFFYGQQNANITCKFLGTPFAVYWMKGSTAASANTLVSRINGKVTGPGSEDGSLTITADYTLVFNNIQAPDAGNYICRVSNHNGFLIVNNTDVRVLDPAVVSIFTEPRITGLAELSVKLPCTFIGTPERVLWHRVQKDSESKSVETVLRYSSNGFEVLGERRYTWSDNYGLIINDVRVIDEGNFTCMVTKTGGTEIENTTVLTVYALAEKPYVQITQCKSQPEKPVNGTASKPCEYDVSEDEDAFALECLVKRVKPKVNVMWREGNRNLNASETFTRRKDGSFDVSLTIHRRTNQVSSTFTCISSGLAVNGTASQSVIVNFIKSGVYRSKRLGGLNIFLIFLFILAISAFLIIVGFRWWKYRKMQSKSGYASVESQENGESGMRSGFRWQMTKDCVCWVFCTKRTEGLSDDMKLHEEKQALTAEEAELKELREKLKNYRPGRETGMAGIDIPVSPVHIGVFGVMGAGKSSFINSLHYALRDEYKNVSIESEKQQGGSETKFRETVQLTEYIHIVDNRGMIDFHLRQVKDDLMPQIKGKRGMDPKAKVKEGKEIHCPVIVCNPSAPVGFIEALQFINHFSSTVNDHFGRYPMVVVTHKRNLAHVDNTEDVDIILEDVVSKMKKIGGVPRNYIQTFENYTEASHEPDAKRHMEYLKFLISCLDVGERNIRFRLEKDAEQPRTSIGRLSKYFGKK